jgi:putative tricarboxylic transport membrane protein
MEPLLAGLAASLSPVNLGYAALGALIGTAVGVLPGLGPVATMALLLPVSFHLSPEGALILLAGVYYGAQYGSSTTAILINVPGEASGAVTALEGHRLACTGRAAEALAVAALASLVAGLFAALVLALATPPLAALALRIGPSETAALLVAGAGLAVLISDGGPAKGVLMLAIGGLLGLIGTAGGDGQPRFSFGLADLRDGIDFTPLVVGLFGFSEVLALMARGREPGPSTPSRWWPGRAAIRGWFAPALRGGAVGSLIGLMPGATTLFAAFAAYTLERRLKTVGRSEPSLAGVAAPEAANNAAAQSSFVMLFGLGLPANAATAVLIGAMMLHGLPPGPALFSAQPSLFWTFIGSLLVANVMLVVLNLPLVGVWARLITIPPAILAPAILVLAGLGVLASTGKPFDVLSLAAFGLFGYAARRGGYPLMPLLMGFVIAAPFEDHLRRAITHQRGDWLALVSQPSVIAIVLVALLLALGLRRLAAR